MKKWKIFMTDSLFPDQELERNRLAQADMELVVASKKETETFIREGAGCHGVIVTYAEADRAFIESLTQCKVMVRTGIGYNNIDVEAAGEMGIMVANVPDYCFDEVADHAIALMLSLMRKTVVLDRKVRQGSWDINLGRPIKRLRGLVLGVYGFGNIARSVCQKARAFGMEVVAYDPFLPDEIFTQNGVVGVRDWAAFLGKVDVLSLHAPLTEETRGVINKESLRLMKPTACLINTARGPLVREEDLYQALRDGVIALAGLDVMEHEPPARDTGLLTLDNVVITPHAAFYSDEAELELREKSVDQVILALTQGAPKYWVNKPK